MEQRFDVSKLAPEGYKAMYGVHTYVQKTGLDLGLLEILRLRISQINGCAFCLAMHVPLAREHGVSDDKLNLVVAWREAPIFSARERAALAWAEALTVIAPGGASDATYAELQAHFGAKEIADLTFMVAEINAWNRLMVASRTPPQLG